MIISKLQQQDFPISRSNVKKYSRPKFFEDNGRQRQFKTHCETVQQLVQSSQFTRWLTTCFGFSPSLGYKKYFITCNKSGIYTEMQYQATYSAILCK